MMALVLASLYVLLLWWGSTGLVLYVDGRPRRTHAGSMAIATGVLVAALGGLDAVRDDTSAAGAYIGFTCALLAWGWLEMSFLLGYITGPNRAENPRGCTGWPRLRNALGAILWHELALVAGAVVVAWAGAGENRVGLWTYLILWAMRTSAKLNVFLGVRNLSEEFLPGHLRYLRSHFRRRPMNLLLPFSITISTVIAVLLWQQALAPGVPAAAGTALLAALMSLAVLEHWFLVLPLPVAALWKWGLRSRGPGGDADGADHPGRFRRVAFPASRGLPVGNLVPACEYERVLGRRGVLRRLPP